MRRRLVFPGGVPPVSDCVRALADTQSNRRAHTRHNITSRPSRSPKHPVLTVNPHPPQASRSLRRSLGRRRRRAARRNQAARGPQARPSVRTAPSAVCHSKTPLVHLLIAPCGPLCLLRLAPARFPLMVPGGRIAAVLKLLLSFVAARAQACTGSAADFSGGLFNGMPCSALALAVPPVPATGIVAAHRYLGGRTALCSLTLEEYSTVVSGFNYVGPNLTDPEPFEFFPNGRDDTTAVAHLLAANFTLSDTIRKVCTCTCPPPDTPGGVLIDPSGGPARECTDLVSFHSSALLSASASSATKLLHNIGGARVLCSWTAAELKRRIDQRSSWAPPVGFTWASTVAELCPESCSDADAWRYVPLGNQSHRAALHAFRTSTGGAKFGGDTFWADDDPCNWCGVQCSMLSVHGLPRSPMISCGPRDLLRSQVRRAVQDVFRSQRRDRRPVGSVAAQRRAERYCPNRDWRAAAQSQGGAHV